MKEEVQDHQEVEWQFDALDVRPVIHWLRSDSLGRNPLVVGGETREISDGYFDTDDWRIHRAGYALRIRRTKNGNKAEATMKRLASENGRAGVRSRREISELLDSADPETLNGAGGPVGDRVRALAGPEALRLLFEVKTRRSTHDLMLDGLRAGEVALDETAIPLDDEEPARLRRVEVEVESEAFDRLEPFVERLREECKLSPAVASKYESGLFARGISPPAPPDYGPTEVDGSLSAGEFAFRIMRVQFGIFLDHEPGTRIGEDPEELHDMRVATRRIRAAMKIFEGSLPARTRGFRDALKWVAGALGEVRDLDVQLGRLEAWISDAPEDREPLGALRAVLEEQRAKARKAMLRTLDSRRYERLVTSFGSFLRKGPSRRALGARRPILEAAPDLLRKPYRKVRKLGDPLTDESSGEEYHELRKKGKRLRYALEFLSGVYGDPMKEFIKPLKDLQDVLGDHQDAEVASSLLRELSVARGRRRRLPPETIFVMGGISHRYEVQARELRAQFPEAYRNAVRKKWKKIRGVMEKTSPQQ